MWYCNLFVTEPSKQGRGYGSLAMEESYRSVGNLLCMLTGGSPSRGFRVAQFLRQIRQDSEIMSLATTNDENVSLPQSNRSEQVDQRTHRWPSTS